MWAAKSSMVTVSGVETSEVTRAISAAVSMAASLDLPTDNVGVLHNSNKLTLRLASCDVLARVSHVGQEGAQLELERARRLLKAGCPVGVTESRTRNRSPTNPNLSPELNDADRKVLGTTLRNLRLTICALAIDEQLLHGEPHRGNVLTTNNGPSFMDFETSCHGPIEFDLAYVPERIYDHYPRVNQQLLDDCRQLVLAMVAAWR